MKKMYKIRQAKRVLFFGYMGPFFTVTLYWFPNKKIKFTFTQLYLFYSNNLQKCIMFNPLIIVCF